HPFHALHLPLSPPLRLDNARLYSSQIGPLPPVPLSYEGNPSRLRIGYVSSDFRTHPTAHLMGGLLPLHDRKRFEVFGYSLRKDEGSPYRKRIMEGCDHFIDLDDLSDEEAARRIAGDGIHILVDLNGYTQHARPGIFARRPAPIQVNYLGFPGTLGAPWMDYIIADPFVLTEEEARYYTEKPVYLPECYQVNDRHPIAETGITRASQGLPEQAFIFCCFNAHRKIEPEVFHLWMEILREVPGSVLWLFREGDRSDAHLLEEAERQGIGRHRLVFSGFMEKSRHLERLRLADLFLDTFTYNGHTTTSDALWAGVPVITCPGESFPSRVAASLLRAVGLPELIADDPSAYRSLAIRLSRERPALSEIRSRLWENRLTHPLFDTGRFARHLEEAFLRLWGLHRAHPEKG
ncbi:MAG: TIGR03032 family protein, partial [Gammaproteobacteria bacterium]